MIDHFARKRFICQFGEPIFENYMMRIVMRDSKLKLYCIKSKRWQTVHESDEDGFFVKIETNIGNGKIILDEDIQEELKVALSEWYLISENN